MKSLSSLLVLLTLSACSITQEINPVSKLTGQEICIVGNPEVNVNVLKAYKKRLKSKGFTVRVLPEKSAISSCKVTSTYDAIWTWDIAVYLSYAWIKIYDSGAIIGEAEYDSRWGGARFDKFINAETKIKEMVDQLFPSYRNQYNTGS